MFRTMLKSKIHRATVTQADLNYVGSLTLDPVLMAAADLLPNELVHIVDINNGNRFETYVIEGEPGSGMVKVNGAAARLVHTGDLVIVIGYGLVPEDRAAEVKPHVVFVDEHNRVLEESDNPGLAAGRGTLEAVN
ncbi:aspartate 1-decarboxylase [Streptomyces europaeiscabiei]|uniref:aspartate 1-decarboxylase n=1 Tax=Streptomyces europaeiscabiei TaxID=146819 RepID=UPI002E16BB30